MMGSAPRMSLRSGPAGPVLVGPVGPVPVGPVGPVPVGPVGLVPVGPLFYMSNCRVKNAALGIAGGPRGPQLASPTPICFRGPRVGLGTKDWVISMKE